MTEAHTEDAAPAAPSAPTSADRTNATTPRDRRARAQRIQQILDEHIPTIEPFLDHTTPFQLLVATILSAQCTDARVNVVTPTLFARAPDAAAMAAMTVYEIRPLIRSCGLAAAKARALRAMSRALVAKHGGHVPRDLATLEQLPGVGHKTASVVLAQAFGDPAFPVDTHVHRLAGRWQLSHARNVDQVERDLKQLFARETWNKLHLQLIHFGRTVCTAKGHDPGVCPVCSWAMSKARATAELRQGLSKPVRRKRTLRGGKGGAAARGKGASATPTVRAPAPHGKRRPTTRGNRVAATRGNRAGATRFKIAATSGKSGGARRAKAGSAKRTAARSPRHRPQPS
jgi:endonuclease III